MINNKEYWYKPFGAAWWRCILNTWNFGTLTNPTWVFSLRFWPWKARCSLDICDSKWSFLCRCYRWVRVRRVIHWITGHSSQHTARRIGISFSWICNQWKISKSLLNYQIEKYNLLSGLLLDQNWIPLPEHFICSLHLLSIH